MGLLFTVQTCTHPNSSVGSGSGEYFIFKSPKPD